MGSLLDLRLLLLRLENDGGEIGGLSFLFRAF